MSVGKSTLAVWAGAVLAASVSSIASAAPAVVTPGDTGIPIPTFSGTPPTVSVLFDTKVQSDTIGSVTVDFEEVAVKTSLNPSGVSFGFMITASNVPTSLSAMLPGFGNFMTAVESCNPFISGPATCGTATGTAARSTSGDLLTFAGLGTTPLTPPPGAPALNASNIYGIFTDAPSFVHPTTVTVTDDGTAFSFKGIGASASTAAPEPATLTLLGLGLLGLGITRRRRA